MKSKLPIAILIIVSCLIFDSCNIKKTNPSNVTENEFFSQDTSWKSLTLREKIGQTMIIVARYYEHENYKGGNLDSFFNKYPVSGFFIADWYFSYYAPKDSDLVYYIKKSLRNYDSASKYPLFFVEDFEKGLGEKFPSYTFMPAEMTLGAANSEQLAFNYGKSIAMEASNFGLNWLLHPVADLSMNPLHSLLNERALSDNPDIAIPLLKKQIDGMFSQNIISTIKHFPGDGFTMRDQHLMTATNKMGKRNWNKTYGKVFQSLIDYNVPSIMVGHITLPSYQKKKYNGDFLPASLSEEVIIKLLKEKMNFEGVVISDALNMGGAAGYYPNVLETAIECFKAGVDIVLWPDLSYMDTLEARILRKEISIERLNDAVERIWALKERFGLLKKNKRLFDNLNIVDRSFIQNTAKEVSENGITLIRGDKKTIVLDKEKVKRILLVDVSERDKTQIFLYTKKLLEDRGFIVDLRYNLPYLDWDWRMDSLAYYDKIIACLENRYFDPIGVQFFNGFEAQSVWTFNMLPKQQMVAVSYSNPYFLNYYFNHIPVLVNAYGSCNYTQEAVVRALTGEIQFKGTSPVTLDCDIFK